MEARRVWDAEVGGSSPPTPTFIPHSTHREAIVRGRKTSKTARKDADIVIVAARYEEDGSHLAAVQAFRRRGFVWGDVEILDRPRLIQELEGGARVFTGSYDDLTADFTAGSPVELSGSDGAQWVTTPGEKSSADRLNLPRF